MSISFAGSAVRLTEMAAIWDAVAERAERRQPVAQQQQQMQSKKLGRLAAL